MALTVEKLNHAQASWCAVGVDPAIAESTAGSVVVAFVFLMYVVGRKRAAYLQRNWANGFVLHHHFPEPSSSSWGAKVKEIL